MMAPFQKCQIRIVGCRWLADRVYEEAGALWCTKFRTLQIIDWRFSFNVVMMYEFSGELVPRINTQLGILIQPYYSIIMHPWFFAKRKYVFSVKHFRLFTQNRNMIFWMLSSILPHVGSSEVWMPSKLSNFVHYNIKIQKCPTYVSVVSCKPRRILSNRGDRRISV